MNRVSKNLHASVAASQEALAGQVESNGDAQTPIVTRCETDKDHQIELARPVEPHLKLTNSGFTFNRTARVIPNAANRSVMERYRRLRTKMIQQHAIKPFRSVVVASPGAQEGKTVTVCNLAIIFSMLPEYRVLVVDGDLRRHELTTQTGLIGQPGFGNLLDGSAHLDEVLHPCTDFPFFVIGSGNSETPAAELLHSPRMKMLTELMKDRFNLILIDSCPVNLIADTQLLASYADAVLMVARCFTTSSRELEKAANDLRQFRVIGAVLNSGTQSQLYGGKNVYY